MSVDKLHPTVEEFKQFMNAHPEIVLKLRKNGNSLQHYYNKWIEHGEDEAVWDLGKKQYEESDKNNNDLFHQVIKYTENIDVKKVQKYVKQFHKTLDTIQLLLDGFISDKETNVENGKQKELFNFFRD